MCIYANVRVYVYVCVTNASRHRHVDTHLFLVTQLAIILAATCGTRASGKVHNVVTTADHHSALPYLMLREVAQSAAFG